MKKTKLFYSFILSLLLVVVLIGCGQTPSSTDSYVTMQINPSIEMIVSSDEKVTYAGALNADGEILLSEITLISLELDAAVDLVIHTSIELGFIEVTDEYVSVEVSAVSDNEANSEAIKHKIITYINLSFQNQAVIGRGEMQDYDEQTQNEAQEYGVSPEFLLLVKAALYVDDTLTFEAALQMEVSGLQAIIEEAHNHAKIIAQDLRGEYLEARAELQASFEVAKAQLEAQIEAANENKDELIAELETLLEAHDTAMVSLRSEFLIQTQVLRIQYAVEFQLKKQLNLTAFTQFINQLEARKTLIIDSIIEFQQSGS